MARPERNNVDYFPFICEEGKKMYYIEEMYGNDGFATFVKILRELAKADFHFLDLSKDTTMMFLSAKCKVNLERLKLIINDLVVLGKFDKMLWDENSIIWCQDFIDSIQDAYLRRNNNCITYDGLLIHLISLGVRKKNKCKFKVCNNTQSKVEDIKEDKNKVEYPFDSDTFLKKWNLWKDYRKEIKKPIKGKISEQAALIKISELSNSDEKIACKIIEQSISNNWQGLFELKSINNGKQNSTLKQEILDRMEKRCRNITES